MSVPADLSRCFVMNTVAAARALLRRYDAQLKPYGVTVQQLSLLSAICNNPGSPVMGLAERVLLDRTSLARNLDLLEKKGLVRRVIAPAGNRRLCELTQEGAALLNLLLPEWERARAYELSKMSAEEASTYLNIVKRLAAG